MDGRIASKPLIEELEEYLLRHWLELPTSSRRPVRLSFLAQGTGVSKLVLFVFNDSVRLPSLVLKLPRHPAHAQRLLAETSTVSRVRAELPAELARSLPGPFRVAHLGGQPVIIEPYLQGQPVEALIPACRPLNPHMTHTLLCTAARWLVEAQNHAPSRAAPLDARTVYDHFVSPVQEARSYSRLSKAEDAYLSDLADLAQQDGVELPLFLYHGDFRAGNLLLADEHLSVLDWEFSRPLAPPLLDWFSFAFRLYCQSIGLADVDGPMSLYRAAFEHVFLTRNWFSERVAEHTLEICRALRVNPSAVPVLLGLFVVENINKFRGFLEERAGHDYVYLLQDEPQAGASFRDQLRRQAYVGLLDLLAERTLLAQGRHLPEHPR